MTYSIDEMTAAIESGRMAYIGLPSAFEGIKELDMPAYFRETEQAALDMAEATKAIGKIAVDVGGLIAQNITQSIIDMAHAMGEGMNSIGEFGAMLLKSIGDFLVSLGEALVAAGVATVVAETQLFQNPWAAIAAGAALVGIGAALGAAQKNAMKDLQSGSGSSYSGVSDNERMVGLAASRQEVLVSGRIVAEGSQLVTIIENQNKRSNSTGGRIIGG